MIKKEEVRTQSKPVNASWLADNLIEDQHYYWRVRASDFVMLTMWLTSDFIVNKINNAPIMIQLNRPTNDAPQ